MKYPLYILASVVLFAGASLGVASAASDNGLTGVVAKLEEVKTAILGLTLSVPSPLDVNVVSPDPLNVAVTNFQGEETQAREPKLIKVFDNATIPATTEQKTTISDTLDFRGYNKISVFVSAPMLADASSDAIVTTRLAVSPDEKVFLLDGQQVSINPRSVDALSALGSVRTPYARIEVITNESFPLNEALSGFDAWVYLMP